MSRFLTELQKRLLVFDGAMGTALHALNLPLSDYRGLENCMEILSDTRPDAVQSVHEAYLAAGCDAVETNTFGGNQIVLAEFGIAERTRELNKKAAEVARAACDRFTTPSRPRFVVGSAGPGTKLPTLGHVEPEVLHASYREQGRGLLDGGADVLLVETCQDLLQCKLAVQAMLDAMDDVGRRVPLMAQVTMETSGTMLVGTEMPAVIAALAPYPLAALGMNCATGPREMAEHVQVLSTGSPFPISCLPNAGLPELVDGHTHYPLSPEELARWLERFVVDWGVRIVGGCCGTTAPHMAAVVKALEGKTPGARTVTFRPSVTSLYRAETLKQDTSILLVGERTNANGSRQFKKLLEAGDMDGMVRMAREQVAEGSHVLDVCVAYVGRDETKDLDGVVKRLRTDVRVPLMIDSTEPPVMERALMHLGGRSILNSVNLEDGEPRCDKVFGLARRHGAAVVALTIDEEGMAKTADRKVAIARRLHDIAKARHGLSACDLLFDPLTFTICTGNEDDRKLGVETLRGIAMIKDAFPEAGIILGVSNISFGLRPAARHILNSVFLWHAQQAGLTAAIVHAAKIMPLNRIDPAAREVAEDLVFDRRRDGYDPLQRLIGLTQDLTEEKKVDLRSLPVEERLKRRIVEGERVGLDQDLDEALTTRKALAIVNDVLLDGMKVVGDLFASGEMQLPFVLQSAETMKAAVAHLEPHMDKVGGESKGKIVLATVRGDVHDIGKNLVDIILTNNGYTVYNLGIKQPLEPILEAFGRYEADAIGLSGLLVKSTVVMRENLEEMERRKLQVPVILGGAALNRGYVESDCRKAYGGRVEYAKDAFDGLKLMADVCAKRGAAIPAAKEPRTARRPVRAVEEAACRPAEDGPSGPIRRDVPVPRAPFFGVRVFEGIPLKTVAPYLNEVALFRVQWQIRQKKMTPAEYEKFIDGEIRPKYFELLADLGRRKLLTPKAVVGYFQCAAEGDTLHVFDEGAASPRESFRFPRQVGRQGLCLADFFRPLDSGLRDVVAFTAVTVGEQASIETARLFREDRYQEYLYVHGISVEMAEALAEYVHLRVRADLGIGGDDATTTAELIKQRYRGRRFSPGYPACPELSDQEKIFRLLHPERIGLRLNEEHQLEPEQSTTAIVVHHPQAAYFTI